MIDSGDPVENAEFLERFAPIVDEAAIELAGVLDGGADGCGRDLVEHHARDGHPGREYFDQVPRDRLAFTVLVCREIDLAGRADQAAKLRDLFALFARHDVQGLEVVVHVDAETSPGLGLERRRHVRRRPGQVAYVADRGLDDVVTAENAAVRSGLGRDGGVVGVA